VRICTGGRVLTDSLHTSPLQADTHRGGWAAAWQGCSTVVLHVHPPE
jgi:hypothetical protein